MFSYTKNVIHVLGNTHNKLKKDISQHFQLIIFGKNKEQIYLYTFFIVSITLLNLISTLDFVILHKQLDMDKLLPSQMFSMMMLLKDILNSSIIHSNTLLFLRY